MKVKTENQSTIEREGVKEPDEVKNRSRGRENDKNGVRE